MRGRLHADECQDGTLLRFVRTVRHRLALRRESKRRHPVGVLLLLQPQQPVSVCRRWGGRVYTHVLSLDPMLDEVVVGRHQQLDVVLGRGDVDVRRHFATCNSHLLYGRNGNRDCRDVTYL